MVYSIFDILNNVIFTQQCYCTMSILYIIESNNGLFFNENIAKMNMRMSHFKRILFYI